MGLKYEPSLDGLRAIAAMSVLAAHSAWPHFQGGGRGVDVFFVLSGYLITSLLRAELSRSDRIDYWAFMHRRMLRLYPALLFMLAGFSVFFAMLDPHRLWEVVPAALYVSNLTRAVGNWPAYLAHTWSLGLEFQFYLLWPLVLPLIIKTGRPVAILAGLYLILTALNVGLGNEVTYNLHASGLILGALVTWLPRTHRVAAPLALGCIAVAMAYGLPITLAEVAAAALISAASGFKPLAFGPLPYLGKLSYAVYLWHYPIAYVLRKLGTPVPLNLAITLGLSIGLAWVSFVTVERWRPSGLRAPMKSGA